MPVSIGKYALTFGGSDPYTLTTSLVASNAENIRFSKLANLFAYYTPGAGGSTNTAQITVEVNPFNATEDPNNLYWSQVGQYTNASGTWTEELATFTSNTSTVAGTRHALVPIDLTNLAVCQIRVKAKETVGAGSAGTIRVVLTTNTIN